MNNEAPDTEFIILENIYDSSEQAVPLRQRDLAQIAGTSLGMTNAILKRLAKKGWISVKKMNSRNIQYAITLEGINEIIHRSYGYFKRTIRNVVFYKDRIDEAILKAKNRNVSAVLLIGMSDLEFILEHACQRHGLSFLKVIDDKTALQVPRKNTLAVYAETVPIADAGVKKNILYLSRMVIEKNTETEKIPQGVL
ncbi:MAG: MarR family transcriptional regulator [Spirochaetaceae bacterium]|jgi:DNA-binding MarR family transcriptional regulator|nr:MarR family transcriptional regulator [Spirochaetaceae bacterium]